MMIRPILILVLLAHVSSQQYWRFNPQPPTQAPNYGNYFINPRTQAPNYGNYFIGRQGDNSYTCDHFGCRRICIGPGPGCQPVAPGPGPNPTPVGKVNGVVVFNVGNAKSGVRGQLLLTQEYGWLRIQGVIQGLNPGKEHGFHVHDSGDIIRRQNCTDAKGHFDPHKNPRGHGSPTSILRHLGDLGNIRADGAGMHNVDIRDRHLTLFGRNSILGRSFVIHEKYDDFGTQPSDDSKMRGSAGGRIACGVVTFVSEE